MKITDAYIKINKKVEFIEKIVAVVIITAIVLIVFSATLSRYLFNSPFYGADRLATYLMIWLGFMGFQIATSKLRHIEIEFIKAKVSESARYKLKIVTSILAAVFLFICARLSFEYLLESKSLGDTDIVLNIPLWIIILIIPVTFSISSIRYMFSSLLWWDVLKGLRKEEDIVKKELL